MTTQITPGQTLKDGDYFEGGTVEQYQELMNIDGGFKKDHLEEINGQRPLYFTSSSFLVFRYRNGRFGLKQKYSFEAFKELCENTFGDEA